MSAPVSQRIEIQRHGGDQRLALAGRHLGDLALMQDDRADQLHIVGDHVPGHRVARDGDFRAEQPATCLPHGREGLGKELVQDLVRGLLKIGLGIRHALRQALALEEVLRVPPLVPQSLDRAFVLSEPLVDRFAKPLRLCGQLGVRRR